MKVAAMYYRDRGEAGRSLASKLTAYGDRPDVIVLGLPRGGVPVAAVVANALHAPLDVFLVRKLGVPGHPELAMGAIASGGVRVLSEDLIAQLGIPPAAVEQVAVRERLELERRDRLYRGDRQLPQLRDRTVILIDDGLATGATMEAAVEAVRVYHPARVVVASPVCARDSAARLERIADEVVCAQTPEPFQAVGLWYERFDQTTDDEVIALLRQASAFAREPARSEASVSTVGADPRVRPAPRQARGALSSSKGGPTQGSAPTPGETIRTRAQVLNGDARDYDALINAIGDARLVLIGEGTHR